jgi:hypothetical protein
MTSREIKWNFANISSVFAVDGKTAAQGITAGLLRVLEIA